MQGVIYSLKVGRSSAGVRRVWHSWGPCCSPLGAPLDFPLGEAGLGAAADTPLTAAQQIAAGSNHPHTGILGRPKSRVRSVVPLLGRVVSTKLCVTRKRQLGKEKREFFCFFGWGVVEDWVSGLLRHGHRGAAGSWLCLAQQPQSCFGASWSHPSTGSVTGWVVAVAPGHFLGDLGTLAALKSSPRKKK